MPIHFNVLEYLVTAAWYHCLIKHLVFTCYSFLLRDLETTCVEWKEWLSLTRKVIAVILSHKPLKCFWSILLCYYLCDHSMRHCKRTNAFICLLKKKTSICVRLTCTTRIHIGSPFSLYHKLPVNQWNVNIRSPTVHATCKGGQWHPNDPQESTWPRYILSFLVTISVNTKWKNN